MSNSRSSTAATLGGSNKPLLDLKNDQESATRFVEAQIKMYGFISDYVALNLGKKDFRLRLSIILKAHQIGFAFIDTEAGRVRNSYVSLSNSVHKPPPSSDVLILLEELCDFETDNWMILDRFYLSAYFLWRFLWIHPFREGNGSVARLISYAILQIKEGFVAPGHAELSVKIAENRAEYYDALSEADYAWANGLVDVSRLEEFLKNMIRAQFENL